VYEIIMRVFPGIATWLALSMLVIVMLLVWRLPSGEPLSSASQRLSSPAAQGPERFSRRAATSEPLQEEKARADQRHASRHVEAEEFLGYVTVDRSALAREVAKPHTMVIPLGQGRTGHVVLQQRRAFGGDENAWQWVGKLSEDPYSSVVLTAHKGHIFGSLFGADGPLEFRQVDGGTVEVVRLDASALPDCGVQDGDGMVEASAMTPEPLGASQAGVGTRYVDIVVAYNNQAREALGGAGGDPSDNAAIEAKIISAVALSNLAYENSNIDMVMRLAWLGMIDYPYPVQENFARALAEATDPSDGKADELAEKKLFYNADFASLWLANNVTGGLANVLTSSAQKQFAFSVVRAQNPIDTFVHEVGHNMGCRHLRTGYSNTPNAWTPYAFAHSFKGSDEKNYTTVMASATDTTARNAIRIPYFSNPSVSYLSAPTGVEGTENCAKTLRDNRGIYESFYPTPSLSAQMVESQEAFTVSLANGFVQQRYELWRAPDLRSPTSWSSLGEYATDNEGKILLPVDRGVLTKAFYQWRRLGVAD
jgi:hypothetical protein